LRSSIRTSDATGLLGLCISKQRVAEVYEVERIQVMPLRVSIETEVSPLRPVGADGAGVHHRGPEESVEGRAMQILAAVQVVHQLISLLVT
jgi:hypothetical protein